MLTRGWFFSIWFLFGIALSSCSSTPTHVDKNTALVSEKHECVVCSMDVGKKTHFESTLQGKPIHFCSFVCAHQFIGRYPNAPMRVFAYPDGKQSLDALSESTYFLIKSKNIASDLQFGMPPLVVAFPDAQQANHAQASIGDGELVRGFHEVQKAYQK